MEQVPEPPSVDHEVNGLIPPVSKSVAEAEHDNSDSSITADNDQSDSIPRETTENNFECFPINCRVSNRQEVPENQPLDPSTDAELANTLDNQHLDNADYGIEGGESGAGESAHHEALASQIERVDTSDPALESNDAVEQAHTSHKDQEAETRPHTDNKPSNLQDGTLIEEPSVKNQDHTATQSATSNGGASLPQLTSSIPSQPEPPITAPTSHTVEASSAIQNDTSNEETVYFFQSNIIPPSSTTPISPTFARVQPSNDMPHRTWESDKDANECRRCKRRFNFLVRRHHCRRCGQVVCDRCSTHRANMARSQIVQDPSVPNWQQAQLATQPQRICDKCYAEMRPPSGLRSATAPPSQPQRIAGHGSSHIRRSTSSQSIMSECPVCGKRLSNVSLDKDVQEEHVQSCLNVGSPSVATVRYVCKCNNQACDLFSVRHIVITR
ncbi:hypothetical protein VKS41_001249 [Umbelopsis sp. WA50703]